MITNMKLMMKNHSLLILIPIFLFVILLQACTGETTPIKQPSAGQERKGELRVALQPIVQTDPAFISSDPEIIIAGSVYDYLVDVTAQNNISPRLAREWTVSEDGKEFVFSLVENTTFHDGTLFTADDVVWTFDRLRDPEVDSPTKDLYSNIESIEATGQFEVTFTLKNPTPSSYTT